MKTSKTKKNWKSLDWIQKINNFQFDEEVLYMKKSISRIIGVIMLIVAIVFIVFALNHPEKSFPWNNTITWLLYGIYFLVTVVLLIAPKMKKWEIPVYQISKSFHTSAGSDETAARSFCTLKPKGGQNAKQNRRISCTCLQNGRQLFATVGALGRISDHSGTAVQIQLPGSADDLCPKTGCYGLCRVWCMKQ